MSDAVNDVQTAHQKPAPSPAWHVNLAGARRALGNDGERVAYAMRRGTMRIGLYAPIGIDDQTPHTQDELYLVTAGSALIVRGGERARCGVDDVIFVPAGMLHRFEDMSADFETCVVFWGAHGGEDQARPADRS